MPSLSLSAEGMIAVIDIAAQRVLREMPAGDTPDGVAHAARVVIR